MELVVGPFDPALHVRSRDHYEAVRREAQLLDLQSDAVPRRLEELTERHFNQLVDAQVDPVVDGAFLDRQPSFSLRLVVPDEQVPALLADCDELARLGCEDAEALRVRAEALEGLGRADEARQAREAAAQTI